MMNHPEEGTLQALLDGELTAEDRAEVEQHLDRCDSCSAELAALRAGSALFSRAAALLDPPPASKVLRPPSLRASKPPRWSRMALPRAAVLVFGFAAAASAAIPGSPIRAWLEDVIEPGTAPPAASRVEQTAAPVIDTAAPAAVTAAESGVSVAPANGTLRVVVTGASTDLRLRAVLTESDRAWVIASGEATGARFETGAGRIDVSGVGPGELRIELPRALSRASVQVNGVPYLTMQAGLLNLAVPAEDSADAEITFRVRP